MLPPVAGSEGMKNTHFQTEKINCTARAPRRSIWRIHPEKWASVRNVMQPMPQDLAVFAFLYPSLFRSQTGSSGVGAIAAPTHRKNPRRRSQKWRQEPLRVLHQSGRPQTYFKIIRHSGSSPKRHLKRRRSCAKPPDRSGSEGPVAVDHRNDASWGGQALAPRRPG